MNVIDISIWQAGLNLESLYEKNPKLGGVVVKSTGGVTNVQTTCDPWVQWLIDHNKPWGFYHFLDDDYKNSSGKAEAEFWVRNCSNYFGYGIPFADYENPAKNLGTAYLKEFLDRVYELTGIKPCVYSSLSVVQAQDFRAIANSGYRLWLAQYANNQFTGFQEHPWQNGSYAPFQSYMMHQYSSCGRLSGWNKNLDLNLFYGDEEDWKAIASGGVEPVVKSVDPSVVWDVLDGKYGVREERAKKLKEAGYNPDEVQDKIDELYAIALSCKKYVLGNEDYLDSISKILGVI